ncbi:YolD-like family protein [Polycladomyces subterraneus]|uniref:YolD-like family protein n=1 Tax=Polycladomyces subterraneus TaxID=1016997 RepID=A0ABT8IQU3_9BACL|nr:YolD-like family protein [Polycladomyces subterraneus]MDN4594479.1 YolD-like family protein [Polycladomyces subterraneus]
MDRGNKLWEGHRMFLPEHAALYRERKRERHTPPVLDEQRWEEIDRLVSKAMREGRTLCWTIFHPDGPYVVQGRVGRIRPEQGWIEVCEAEGRIRVPLNRLVDVRSVEE